MTNEHEIEKTQLPEPVARRGIDEAQWRTLIGSIFPGAKSQSVLAVVDYCIARKLDPLKKPCHIVPMYVRDTSTGEQKWRDVILAGIYEYRTTAQRTGQYMGHSKPEYGPEEHFLNVNAPAWCEMTIRRWNPASGTVAEFPVRTYFVEVVVTSKNKETGEIFVNARWSRAPMQMLTKCCEAAGLREAFPDEFGGTQTAEEMEGRTLDDAGGAEDKELHAKPAVEMPQEVVRPNEVRPPVSESAKPKVEMPKDLQNWLDDMDKSEEKVQS